MTTPSFARSPSLALKLKPVTAAMAFGGLVGLAVGCAYLGGTVAKATTLRHQAERLQGATAAGFTDEALAIAVGGLDESALAIARRHDPYDLTGDAGWDRQGELLTARLDKVSLSRLNSGLRTVSNGGPAASPFSMGGALEASRDLECRTQAVYYEARGEGRDGMRAVAQVVLNRARHRAFPRTVCGVVFQGAGRRSGCQFSFTCDGSMHGRVNRAAWNRAKDIASSALSGYVYGPVGTATHFHTTAVSPVWRNTLVRVSQVGQHVFYRFGGRRSGLNATAQPSMAASSGLQQASLTVPDMSNGPVAYAAVVAAEVGDKPAAAVQTTASAGIAPATESIDTPTA